MRFLLVALLLASCTGDCSGVGAVGSMRAGDMQHGAARGGMAVPVDGDDAPALAGVDWPEDGAYGDILFLFEPAKETAFADGAGMATATNFGSVTMALAQATGTAQPTYQTTCSVGPAVACAYCDGGDWIIDSVARAGLIPWHDGSGSTVYVFVELASTTGANSYVVINGLATTDVGAHVRFSSGASDRLDIQYLNGSGGTFVALTPAAGTGLQDQTWGMSSTLLLTDTPDTTVEWYGTAGGGARNASSAASSASPSLPLSVCGLAAGARITGAVFSIIIYNARHAVAERAAVLAAAEAVYGTLPQ